MERNQVVAIVAAALREVLNRDLDGITEDTRLFEDLAVDSTSVIELLMGLEDAIALEVDPDSLDPESFETVGSLTDYVLANIAPVATAV